MPAVSKKNYLRQYDLADLAWGGTLKKNLVFTATSGSTGEPFYFPRSSKLDWQGSFVHEMFFNNGSRADKGPVLVLVCFGMGVWIGGLITYKGYEMAAARGGYPISILTPGINKKEIYNALKKLAPHFSQTILVGYPPFIKDIIDGAKNEGIDLHKLHIRLSFAAEAFTEQFRDYLVKVGKLKDPHLDTLNVYGSADIGAMGFETPISIFARRMALERKELFADVFGSIVKTPTLAQYIPGFITFEAPKGEVLLTGDNTIPLVRYAIGDNGGVLSFGEMEEKFKKHGVSLRKEASRRGNAYRTELPFVYVYERNDLSTTLYGLQIYPEHVREALIHPSVQRVLTGKFSMATKYDAKHDQYLEVHLEQSRSEKVEKEFRDRILKMVVLNLERRNSEFKELHRFLGKRAWPRLVFWPPEDTKYFRVGIKQQWVIKNQ